MLCNKLLVGSVILVAGQAVFAGSNSLADYQPGFYVGAQGGYARTNEGRVPEDVINRGYDLLGNQPKSKDINKGKLGGRLFVGYSFLPYFGLETGCAYYPSNEYKFSGRNTITGASGGLNFNVRFYTVDFMAKGVLPLEVLSSSFVGWNLYGKLGAAVALVHYKLETQGDTNSNENRTNQINASIVPSYALGIGYDFTDHFGIDVSWAGVYRSGKFDNIKSRNFSATPSANLVSLGISYKF
ncbi:putative OMP_b-brl domain-containing protein [Gammaproteobacteria bacterium]